MVAGAVILFSQKYHTNIVVICSIGLDCSSAIASNGSGVDSTKTVIMGALWPRMLV